MSKVENNIEGKYSERFKKDDAVTNYQNVVYAEGSYDNLMWKLQQNLLKKEISRILSSPNTPSVLDFACGTGRVTRFLERYNCQIQGLDLSEKMAEVARKNARKSDIVVGDILSDRDVLIGPYDLITAFRFFLNLEPNLRLPILIELSRRLKDSGRLIFNIHGNLTSVRHLALLRRKLLYRMNFPEMSRKKILNLIHLAGFEVESSYGFGVVPPVFYRTFLNKVAFVIDKGLCIRSILKYISIDLLFICKKGNHGPL